MAAPVAAAAVLPAAQPQWQPSAAWQANQANPQRPPTVIEATSKGWKSVQLFGALGCIFGVILGIAMSAAQSPGGVGFAVLLGIIGFIAFIVGRIGAWWDHG
jgi:hypothetical protein